MKKGIELESERIGSEAVRGDTITVRYDLFLNRGELIQSQETTFTIGKRRVIAGLEYGVEGMLEGGQRRIRVAPHLAYGTEGVESIIPRNARSSL